MKDGRRAASEGSLLEVQPTPAATHSLPLSGTSGLTVVVTQCRQILDNAAFMSCPTYAAELSNGPT